MRPPVYEVQEMPRRRRSAPLWAWTRAIAAVIAMTALVALHLAGRL